MSTTDANGKAAKPKEKEKNVKAPQSFKLISRSDQKRAAKEMRLCDLAE